MSYALQDPDSASKFLDGFKEDPEVDSVVEHHEWLRLPEKPPSWLECLK